MPTLSALEIEVKITIVVEINQKKIQVGMF